MSDKKQSIGGAWVRTSKSGNEFLSMTIGDKRYTLFRNNYKKPGDKSPDWKVYEDDWKKPEHVGNQPIPEVPGGDTLPF